MSLELYDITGRLVKTIYSGVQEKGYYEVNVSRVGLQAGIYFIRLEAEENTVTHKLTILK